MKSFKKFLIEKETTYGGFEVRTPSAEEDKYFKANPKVAGYYGTGSVGDKSQEGTIVVNPYNQYMKDPNKREGLKALEAVRGAQEMVPDILDRAPDLTPEQDKNLNFYSDDPRVRKGTFYSRLAVGDTLNPEGDGEPQVTPEQESYNKEIQDTVLNDRRFIGKIKAQRLEYMPRNLA